MLQPHDYEEEELEVREPRKPSGMYNLTLWLLVVSLSALFLTLFMISNAIRENREPLETELSRIQATLASTPLPDPSDEALSAELINIQSQISALEPVYDEIIAEYVPFPSLMEIIARYDQLKMEISNISQNGRLLIVSGHAADEASVIAYLDRLKYSNLFDSVVIQAMSLRTLPTPTPVPGTATPASPTQTPIRVVDFTISLEPGANTSWNSRTQ